MVRVVSLVAFELRLLRLDLVILEFIYRLPLPYLPQHKCAQGLHAEIKGEKEYDSDQDPQHKCDGLHVLVSVHTPHRVDDEARARNDGAAENHPLVARIHERRKSGREQRADNDEWELLSQHIAVQG